MMCNDQNQNISNIVNRVLKMDKTEIFNRIIKQIRPVVDIDNPDFYNILKYIYKIHAFEQNEMTKKNKVYKKNIFITIAKQLLSKKQMYEKLSIYGYHNSRYKHVLAKTLHNLLYNTMVVEENHLKEVVKIQRFARCYLYRKIIQYNKKISENPNDPFTFDDVCEIPQSDLFSYEDERGHVYKFNAIELDYYITHFESWNPYTKEPFEEKTLRYLNLLIMYNNLKRKTQDDFHWTTPLQAYTDVSHVMERAGFYNNVNWFQTLGFNQIVNIIVLFKDISFEIDHDYFSNEISRDEYQYEFARELVRLFSNSQEEYLLCCNFFKSLSVYSDDFYYNAPEWLSSVQSHVSHYDTQFLTLIYYFTNIE